MKTLDTFTLAYIECALWSSTAYGSPEEDQDDPADAEGNRRGRFDRSFQDCGYGAEDLAPVTLERIILICDHFQNVYNDDIERDYQQAGHDFWLTRNGHGCGFWDGDWPEPAATRLTVAAEAYGEVDLYMGDDGKIYLS
jgi:hypothetical protein